MKLLSCVILFALAAMAVADKVQYKLDEAPALFEKFIKDYNRVYKDEADKQAHFEAFKQSLETINKLNAQPNNSATFGINNLADYTPDEKKHLTGVLKN